MAKSSKISATKTNTKSNVSFQGNEKQKDVRSSNIIAAKAVADAIRTSLGPKGMDKMITSPTGDVIISNDGATILNKLEVCHPAAKMLVEIAKSQDIEAGDGTTSVAIIAGSLLSKSQELMEKGIHPSIISDALQFLGVKCEGILKKISKPVSLDDKEDLIMSATTSLSSKVVSNMSSTLAPIAVDAVLNIYNEKKPNMVNLDDIRVVNKLGGTIDDTQLIDGLVLTQRVSTSAGGPTMIKGAKIALIQFQLSPPKTDIENEVVIDMYQKMERVIKEEKKYILNLVKQIAKSGCNVLLIQKSILRDAVNDMSLYFLAKKGIMVVTEIERKEIEFICKTIGCLPIASIDNFSEDKFGTADFVEEESTSDGKIVSITGVQNPGKTVSILVRGSSRLVVDEAERSLHDALCVVRCLVKQRFLVPGGGAPEMHLCVSLKKLASSLSGLQGYCLNAFADALEVIPYTLAENAGLHPIEIVTELRRRHNTGDKYAGINVKKGKITNMVTENVIQPLLVTTSAINLATECCRMILKIDDIVAIR